MVQNVELQQKDTVTSYVIDSNDMVVGFSHAVRDYQIQKFGNVKSELHVGHSFEIIRAMLDDQLNTRLMWARKSHDFDEVAQKHIPWLFEDARNKELFDDFYCEVCDEYETKLSVMLDSMIGGLTWDIWTTRAIGLDIVLTRGIDYRVYDWERRMRSREWKRER